MRKVIFFSLLITCIHLAHNKTYANCILQELTPAVQESDTTSHDVSETKVALALKEALTIGVKLGVKKLAKTDGFLKDDEVRIPFPEEVQEVEVGLRKIGLSNLVDDAIISMNRAAEDAVIEAKDIFIDAITSMTITDAVKILKGKNYAATLYLEKQTRDKLFEKFKPKVIASLNKVNATKYWETVFTSYNKLPFVQKVNPDMVEYVTNKTIDGLFIQIAKQEKEIRKNPVARVSDLLKQVFGKK